MKLKTNPLVSVCIPMLNAERFLAQTLNSVCNQEYSNLEIIVLDSNSSDKSRAIVEEYQRRDSRIKYLNNEEKGLFLNWNKAISYATGKYTYILPADDLLHHNFLKEAVAALEVQPTISIFQSDLSVIDANNNHLKSPTEYYLYSLYPKKLHIRPPNMDAIFALSGTIPCASLTQQLFLTTLLQSELFSTKFGNKGDFEFQVRIARKYAKIYSPKKLGLWRRHENQATDFSKNPERFLERLKMLKAAYEGTNLDTEKLIYSRYYFSHLTQFTFKNLTITQLLLGASYPILSITLIPFLWHKNHLKTSS